MFAQSVSTAARAVLQKRFASDFTTVEFTSSAKSDHALGDSSAHHVDLCHHARGGW
jgi:hypothetical protein